MTVIVVTVFEAAGVTVLEKRQGGMLLQHEAKHPGLDPSSSKRQGRSTNGRRSPHPWVALSSKTMTSRLRPIEIGPTHTGKLQRVPSRAVRYDDRPAQSGSPHAEGQGD